MGRDGDNDGRLGDPTAGRFLPDTHSSRHTESGTEDTSKITSEFFEYTDRSHLPLERTSPSHKASASTTTSTMPNINRRHYDPDESAPIIQHTQGAAKDYNSISPSISARTTGAESSSNPILNGPERGRRKDRVRENARDSHGDTNIQEAEREAAEQERKESGRWRQFVEKYGSVELENKGSVARDHLALERTFLAWLRTSLSFASIGIAVTQLFRLNTSIASQQPPSTSTPQTRLRHVGKPLGATFIAISILILFIGFHRYFEAQHYVIRGKFPASRGSIVVVSAVAGALIVSSLVVILSVGGASFEK